MTVSPALMKMVERAKLPITVRYQPRYGQFFAVWRDGELTHCDARATVSGATRLYRDITSELESAASSPTADMADCSASAPSPGGR